MTEDFSDDTMTLVIPWAFLSNAVNTNVDWISEYGVKGTVTYMVRLCIPVIWFIAYIPHIGNFGPGWKSLSGKERERCSVSPYNLGKLHLGCCDAA